MQKLDKKSMGMVAVVVLVVGLLSFRGGMAYSNSKSSENPGQYGGMMGAGNRGGQFGGGMGGGRRNMMGGGFTAGDIIAKDDKSITVKLQNGGSKIVFFGGSTKVMKSVDGALTDLEIGKTVMVTGTPNSDGSVTAESVQLRPAIPVAPKTN